MDRSTRAVSRKMARLALDRRKLPASYDARETAAWMKGYSIAVRDGYESIRDCRIFAHAYAKGFLNGERAVSRRKP